MRSNFVVERFKKVSTHCNVLIYKIFFLCNIKRDLYAINKSISATVLYKSIFQNCTKMKWCVWFSKFTTSFNNSLTFKFFNIIWTLACSPLLCFLFQIQTLAWQYNLPINNPLNSPSTLNILSLYTF